MTLRFFLVEKLNDASCLVSLVEISLCQVFRMSWILSFLHCVIGIRPRLGCNSDSRLAVESILLPREKELLNSSSSSSSSSRGAKEEELLL